MILEFNKRMSARIARRFERFDFEVGILEDKPHREPLPTPTFEPPDFKNFAGGPARKTTKDYSEKSIKEIFVANMERLGIDLLRAPFSSPESKEIRAFSRSFFRLVFGRVTKNQTKNLLQAIVRNPILRGDYGTNKKSTASVKGFDRHLIDTAQMFRNITARINERPK